VLIAAHGNSLRALVKYLDNMSDADIMALNIPTGIRPVYASSFICFIIDRVAGEIIRLVVSVCVYVSVRLSVGALLFEPFDL